MNATKARELTKIAIQNKFNIKEYTTFALQNVYSLIADAAHIGEYSINNSIYGICCMAVHELTKLDATSDTVLDTAVTVENAVRAQLISDGYVVTDALICWSIP